jgi:regulatory protein
MPDLTSASAARAAGVRMLVRRELSVAQVRERLARKGFGPAAIEAAISQLTAEGTLDDLRVARAVARTRAFVKRQGRSRVIRELGGIGIAREIAESVIAEVFGDLDESSLLEQALSRRLRGTASLADPGTRRKIYGALARQGFAPDAIMRAIRARAKSR